MSLISIHISYSEDQAVLFYILLFNFCIYKQNKKIPRPGRVTFQWVYVNIILSVHKQYVFFKAYYI